MTAPLNKPLTSKSEIDLFVMGRIVRLPLKVQGLKDATDVALLDEEIDTMCFRALFV